jgi:hypothetical protein
MNMELSETGKKVTLTARLILNEYLPCSKIPLSNLFCVQFNLNVIQSLVAEWLVERQKEAFKFSEDRTRFEI